MLKISKTWEMKNMQQFKRLGGDRRVGKFTEWNKNDENYCIYCGDVAETRDHVPSKAFMIEPYPDNLPTISACEPCNNGFSFDESYVASYINVFRRKLDPRFFNEKIDKALKRDRKLKELLDSQINTVEQEIYYSFDKDKFQNIIIKLAKGHAGFEFDYVDVDGVTTLWYDWKFNLNAKQIESFNMIPSVDIMPEVGSRVFNRIESGLNFQNGESSIYLNWIDVQKGIYRYLVYFDEDHNISVKISICEFLFCIISF